MSESKIAKLHEGLVQKEFSCKELTEEYIAAIEKDNEALNAYVTVTPETALKTAQQVDEKIAAGEEIALLEGIPMTLKDNISTSGIRTTCCSKILEDYMPIYDATVWDDIKVPAHIQMEGWGNPAYVNTQYPWDGLEELEAGEVPKRINPVGCYVKYFSVPASSKYSFA